MDNRNNVYKTKHQMYNKTKLTTVTSAMFTYFFLKNIYSLQNKFSHSTKEEVTSMIQRFNERKFEAVFVIFLKLVSS